MNIQELQTKINTTDYWDLPVLDFKVNFMGDEAVLYLDGESHYWELTFQRCYSLSYKTDADDPVYDRPPYMRDRHLLQIGYFGQDITVRAAKIEGFYEITMYLSMMEVEIVCKMVLVQKIEKEKMHFFWEQEGKQGT